MDTYIVININPSIVLVQPSQIGNRLDASNYRQDYLKNREVIRKSTSGSKKLGNLLKLPSFRGKGLPINETGTIPVIKVRNISDFGISGPYDYTDLTNVTSRERAWVKFGDVLLTVSGLGSSGKADLFWFDKPMLADGHIAILRCTEALDNGYLKAFLSSSYGKKLSDQDTIGSTGQIELYGDYIDNFDIPYPDSKIQAYIGDKVRLAERCREEASQLLKQANSDLISTLGFDLYSMPSAANSSGRGYRLLQEKPGCILVENLLLGNSLLPTRYQSQYLERDRLLAEHVSEIRYLNEIAVDFINGYDCREFQTSGTPYLRVGNIHPNELDLDGVMYVQLLPSQLPKKFRLNLGDLIITRKGSFGFCTSVTTIMEQMIFSSEIIRVPLKKGWDSDYLALFLNSPYGRYQFDRLGTGTTMKGINHENLADIKVPKVPSDVQKTIGGKVRLSMAMNEKSKKLMAEASRDVEDLIDARINIDGILADEVHAPTWEEVYQIIMNDKNHA